MTGSEDSYVFRGGFEIPGLFRIQGPWVILTMTASQLEFRPRSRWWARHFGPWLSRAFRCPRGLSGPPASLYSWGRVNFLAKENMPGTFLAEWPEGVLGAAEELGYPVRHDDRKP